MDEGFPEATSAVIVYGPDGTMYSDPLTARRAGVTNYTMEPPAGVPVTPISPRDSSVPFNPSSEEQRKYFNQFADAYNAYQAPNLAARAPAFTGYGYEAPTTNMVMAPQQMPQLMLDPNAIYDPTVGAALQIMNRPMMIGQMPNMMGAGTDYQRQYSLLRDIAPVKSQQYQRIPDPVSLMDSIGGNNVAGDRDTGFDFAMGEGMGDPRLNLRYNDTMNTGTFVDQFGRTVSNTGSTGLQDYLNFGVVQDAQGGFLGDGAYGGTIGDTGMGVNSQGQTVSNLGTIAAQNNAMFGDDAYYNSESP